MKVAASVHMIVVKRMASASNLFSVYDHRTQYETGKYLSVTSMTVISRFAW